MDWLILTTAFMLGLLSSAHCVGMCGGIMGALTMAVPAEARTRRWVLLLGYNLGRIGSYSLMGLMLGFFGQGLLEAGGAFWLRTLAGLLLIAMGLYLANWWRGLTYLEHVGRYLWAYLQPLGKVCLPVTSLPKALLLGAVWGWLPCGLVYSALVYAMAQGQVFTAALVMLVFGVGTLPAVLATGLAAQHMMRWLQQRHIRWAFALLVIGFGVWTLWAAGGHHGHHHASDHALHEPASTSSPEATSATSSSLPQGQDDEGGAHSHHHHSHH